MKHLLIWKMDSYLQLIETLIIRLAMLMQFEKVNYIVTLWFNKT